jgi:transcription elongation factor GreA
VSARARGPVTAEEEDVDKDVMLTPEGYEKLVEELEDLRTNQRLAVAERIREAREFGDISENSEYDDAKNEQAMLEAKIARLEERLRAAKVIDASEVSGDKVSLGTHVTLQDLEHGDKLEYTIVGSAEADPLEGKLSNESPVGRALLGRAKGDQLEVAVPQGTMKLKIVSIKAR